MRRFALAGALLAIALAILWMARGRSAAPPAPVAPAAPNADATTSARPPAPARPAARPPPAGKRPPIASGWGSGPGQLGRSPANESSPEAPMALAATARGETLVLDQVNARIARWGANGAPLPPWPLGLRTPRDLAVGPRGEVAVLDPAAGRVALFDADGTSREPLPIAGPQLEDPALATSVSVERDGVWIEAGHAWNYRLDQPAAARDGRLSRDGSALLSAGIVQAQAGTAWVRALDASTAAFRWQRRYSFPAPILRLVLLDSFDSGGLVFAAHLAREVAPGKFADETVDVLCLAADGAVLSELGFPPPEGPEETMRELAAAPDGALVYLHRTRAGAELISGRCP